MYIIGIYVCADCTMYSIRIYILLLLSTFICNLYYAQTLLLSYNFYIIYNVPCYHVVPLYLKYLLIIIFNYSKCIIIMCLPVSFDPFIATYQVIGKLKYIILIHTNILFQYTTIPILFIICTWYSYT